MTSSNGTAWQLGTGSSVQSWNAITWGNGKFVAAAGPTPGSKGSMSSSNGTTWADGVDMNVPPGSRNIIWAADPNGGQYVASSATTNIYTSPDGMTWIPHATAPVTSTIGVAYSPTRDLYVAIGGGGVVTSNNGTAWSPQPGAPAIIWRSIVWSPENDEFVAVGINGIARSSDGITWTTVTPPGTNTWEAITWSPELSRYVAVGSNGADLTTVGLVPTVPTVPLSLAGNSSGLKVNLSWSTPTFDGNSAITGYRIERSVNGGAFDVLVANTNSTATTYSDTANIAAGATYSYRIYALNAQGQSLVSNTVDVRVADQLADTGVNGALWSLASLIMIGSGAAVTIARRKIHN
jgi:fibronectin type III domain protein